MATHQYVVGLTSDPDALVFQQTHYIRNKTDLVEFLGRAINSFDYACVRGQREDGEHQVVYYADGEKWKVFIEHRIVAAQLRPSHQA